MFVSTRFADMERSEWMHQIKRMKPQYLVHVKKFVAVTKAHCLSLGWTTTICPCSKCKNMKANADSEVKSHLIRFGFVSDYMVWTFHDEKAVDATTTTTVADASREKTSSSTTVNAEHVEREPVASSSSAATAAPSNDTRDYVMMDDFFQDAADNDGGRGGDEDATVMDP
jgi:hypothetical protein